MSVVCIQFPMYEILQLAIAQILRVELAQGTPKHSHMCLATAREYVISCQGFTVRILAR